MLRGDASVNANWVFYDAPVLAVADGTVVVARDYLEDQTPNAPDPVDIEDGDGNHVVLDIGDGRYVFYAHLAPGSVTVEEGDRVCSGQEIGRLGNTGSSTGPHLHVHVSDSVSALDADGLPYVISGFQLRGQIPPLETEAFALVEAGKPLPVDPGDPEPRIDVLPRGRDVVDFPDAASCD
jgi:murein DD-endopeptidase MepM/ murein hydrolase activator NlpD